MSNSEYVGTFVDNRKHFDGARGIVVLCSTLINSFGSSEYDK